MSDFTTVESITETRGSVLYKRLLTYVWPLKLFFLLSVIGYVIHNFSGVFFFNLVGEMVDSINAGENFPASERLRIPLTLIVIVACRGVGGFLGFYAMAYIANTVVHRIRCQILHRFLGLPLEFYDKNTAGHLMSTVTFNVNQVSLAVSDATTVILREGGWVIAIVSYLLWLNWQLTLVFLAVTPIVSLVVLFASKKFRKHSARIQMSMGDVTQILSETIRGLRVVRTFGAEKHVEDNFFEASQRNRRQNLKLAFTAAISAPVIQVVVASSLALLVWLAMAPEALSAISSPGEFVAYITAAGSLLKPIRQLSKINAEVQKGIAAAESIFKLLDKDDEKDEGTQEVSHVEGNVEFTDVSFAYEGSSENVLNNISFTCQPGETIAIVGKSGSGKSTLVNLIPRFYGVTQGNIKVDGISLDDFSLKNLRSHIALVSQQIVLFNGSIRENIAYGELQNKTDEEIITALENANAMEFVSTLSEGLDTRIGDDGLLLSGGQRQRLVIARALLKDAPILILDEATSALDSESEKTIQSALEHLMKGRTTFVIAHRLSTIEKADRILVMEEGQIVESGTHQELLALRQHYANLHAMQFS